MSGIGGDLSNIRSENLRNLKALTFDVFGTVVDWRTSVIEELASRARARLSGSPALAAEDRDRLAAADWGRFAQEWRDSYKSFTRDHDPGSAPWKDVDAHHYDSLVALLAAWGLGGVYGDEEVRELSLVWHRLRPWADSVEGLRRLGGRFVTATLSNGNGALLRDLDAFAGLGFRVLLSGEDWRAYKPNPVVYDSAVRALLGEGGRAREVAMVASHLGDLMAARSRGMRTVYVERPGEEDWEKGGEAFEDARGWVDVWVGEGEGGFEEVARRLGA
ncbi:haloacid dehalogenase [Colletotrichum graminicola]|uniref:Haloacid dehalogenase n=1 Tax=Colletotrichum graminicola (strain M1.001 / M2 / FGSC 10212) TaxID=645133 RepID=E3QC23_COLGM|nr:haloacid dehalogenase [Colletotrichum graminicola M1.001]EFQ28258.1 haloacid dehalogenase [Colletotrichum graminicola M1.001]WDK20594.1 haloacid dehalogenase [Colletotrichum graminicola]